MTSSALLAGVASSSFVSAYDTKLRRRISCNEDKDISSDGSKLEALTKKDVTNVDDENLVKDDELISGDEAHYSIRDINSQGDSNENSKSNDKTQAVNEQGTGAEKLSVSKLDGDRLPLNFISNKVRHSYLL